MTTNTAEATSGTKDPNDRYEKEEKKSLGGKTLLAKHAFVDG